MEIAMPRRAALAGCLLAAGLSFAVLRSDAAPLLQLVQNAKPTPVDVELVLAVDISYSMDPDEQQLQREGYMKALTSPEFLRALREGMHGKIAVT